MATLQDEVEQALAMDDRVEPERVRVLMRGTTAYLQGEVPTLEMYQAAEDAANTVRGVTSVVNELVVTGEAVDLPDALATDLRSKASDDVLTPGGLSESRLGPFGVEADEATSIEGESMGGPVGGDEGNPQRPQSPELTAPLGEEAVTATGSQLCPFCGSALTWSADMLECPECGPELDPRGMDTEGMTEEYEGQEVLPTVGGRKPRP